MQKKLIGLVKISKQKLDEQERILMRNQMLITKKKEQIDSINLEIASISLPTSGNFRLYQIQKAGIQAYLYEIEEVRKQISLLLKEQEVIKQNIRLAHLQYEKMLYIYNQERMKQEIHTKQIEEKQLNENTLMLYAHK